MYREVSSGGNNERKQKRVSQNLKKNKKQKRGQIS